LNSDNKRLGSFNSIGRWAYAIQNKQKVLSFEEADKEENRCSAFLNSAFMNVRKICGGSNCNLKRLLDYAEHHKDYIREEVEIINPETVVFDSRINCILKELFNFREVGKNVYNGTVNSRKISFIQICHPQASKWKVNGQELRRGCRQVYDGLLLDLKEGPDAKL